MINVNEWYLFKDVIDKKTCNKIKRLAQGKYEPAAVDVKDETTDDERLLGREGDFKCEPSVRISDVFWQNEQWVYDTVWPYMMQANEVAGWRYIIKGAESMQITRYKKGEFYSWHRDGFGDNLSAYNSPGNAYLHGHVRKITMAVLLSDKFEGGAFEFASYDKEKCTIHPIEVTQGSAIVFPSYMDHRVTPVTKGIRYSLITWFVGPPFT